MAEWTSESLYQAALRGGRAKPFWFCGPCAIESRDVLGPVAETLARLRDRFDVTVVFKASFDKANRTSADGFRGPGVEEGLRELEWVKRQFGLPVVTDVHESTQVAAVAEVADVLQIPAFLCRQTDLLVAAARTGKPVNVKKGQFIAPSNARSIVDKVRRAGNDRVFLTERGVTFGYQRLVVDFAAWPELERAGAPLVMDVTHAVQLPGGAGESTGGIRDAIPYLARAAAAAGVAGFFAETHPDPSQARSDGPNAWPLDRLEALFESVYAVAAAAHGVPR
jgi:2-dehydro-3-deoxyphosphooctonate aldolase (KDO 8-P synthase)